MLLDPPYNMEGLDSLLAKIAAQPGLVMVGGVVVAGHSKREELRENYGPMRLTSHRRYGDNLVDFFVYGQDPNKLQLDDPRSNLFEGSSSGGAVEPSW